MCIERPDLSLFFPNLHGGGAERVSVTLANGLVPEEHRVEGVVGVLRQLIAHSVSEKADAR